MRICMRPTSRTFPNNSPGESANEGCQRARSRVRMPLRNAVCHYPDRANRPDQQTFCCVVCGQQAHADLNAATNLAHRWDDEELCACKDRKAVKALLLQRHDDWKAHHGWP